jgi:LacI family transcriptional regulator
VQQPVAIKDIAREAGVSLMTVSRALRKQPSVSAELQARIQRIADELGYRPNPLVSALMSHRRAGNPSHHNLKLGFVTQFSTRDGWRKVRIYAEFFEGAAKSAERHGYKLEEFWLGEPGMTPQRMSQVLMTQNVHGIIMAPVPVPKKCLGFLWEKFSAITIAYSVTEPALHRVAFHHFRSMQLIMQRLRERGYERPGLAMPKVFDARIHHLWLAGFLVEQRLNPKFGRVPALLPSEPDWRMANFHKWLDRARPDVVIGHHDYMVEWLEKSGRRVPEDIGFVHVDSPALDGPFSGIYENGPAVGGAATDLLVAVLHRNERGIPQLSRTVLIEGSWVEGSTLRQSSDVVGSETASIKLI